MFTSQIIFLKLKQETSKHARLRLKHSMDNDFRPFTEFYNQASESILGNHVHGLFFSEILGTKNPTLADHIHQQETKKPFSLSYVYKENDCYWFRVVSWIDEISQAVFSYFNSKFEIDLNGYRFELIRTSTDKAESVWADRISYNDFLIKTASSVRDAFWIYHFSPTSFKMGDSHVPLPVPELVINSIYRQLPEEIQNIIDIDTSDLHKKIHLKQHKIMSVYNKKNQGSIASFIGKTNWQIDNKATDEEKMAINMLFNFAFFCGIGVKTTQGMGMCRLLDK